MEKKNVFFVSGRYNGDDGFPQGEIVNYVVCGRDDPTVRSFLANKASDYSIAAVTPLLALEEHVKKIKAVLAGTDSSWRVIVDPALKSS